MNDKEPIDEVRAERDAALEAIERVRAAHPKNQFKAGGKAYDYCGGCYEPFEAAIWPCPTIQALGGAPEPEWEYQWGEPGESFEGFDSFDSEELARADMAEESDFPSHRVMRRRKAGPWELVEKEQSND